MSSDLRVVVQGVNHWFGEQDLRRQVLFDLHAEVREGEIVIVTGPSGSGKTTLLTLIGALRSTQDGSLRVLGEELRDATRATTHALRRQIGYVFQQHNLLAALTARQNVEMTLHLQDDLSRREIRRRAGEMLEAVGLGECAERFPEELSAGEQQRVAIARSLAGRPHLILADEPTASLDGAAGRRVVDILQEIARRNGVTVLLVTHDNRILDIGDRILHLEDGRLSSFTSMVTANTQHMMEMLAQSHRKGNLVRQVEDLDTPGFAQLVGRTTAEAEEFLRITEIAENDAFQSMLEQVLEAFARKISTILDAEITSLFLVDGRRRELWLKVGQDTGDVVNVRIPIDSGIAGRVATSGRSMNVPDVTQEPAFNPDVDRLTGFKTRNVLCVPIYDRRGRVFAVAQLLNKRGGQAFQARDEARFLEFIRPVGVILESWRRMSGLGEGPPDGGRDGRIVTGAPRSA